MEFPPSINVASYIRPLVGRITMREVVDQVTGYYHVSLRELVGDCRSRSKVLPRQVAMYLLRRYTHFSLDEIGAFLGGRDHTTILHGVKATEMRAEQLPEFAEQLRELERRLVVWTEKVLRKGGRDDAVQ